MPHWRAGGSPLIRMDRKGCYIPIDRRRRLVRWRIFAILALAFLSTVTLTSVMRRRFLLAASALAGITFGNPIPDDDFVPANGVGPRLNFKSDGTFQISVFEDLHFGEGEDNPPELGWGPLSDIKTSRVMNNVLDSESPQLVVLNGDLITGENTHKANSTNYLDIIVKPLVNRNLVWASTYGNHDRDYNLSVAALLQKEQQYPKLSLTRSMVKNPDAGATNYYLPVYGNGADGQVPALLLWFFDSRGGMEYQKLDSKGNRIGIPEFVHDSVVSWFRNTRDTLTRQYGRAVPSLGFVHIPVNAMAAFQNTGVDPNKQPGINDDNPLAPQTSGRDVSFMSALLETKGLMAIFSGHDHGDDWCYKWDKKLPTMNLAGNGLSLCFGRHTGYGGYGKWTRGSRQIRVHQNTVGKEVETWIRLEDKSVSGAVVLNSTYGSDIYPAAKDTFSTS